MEFRKYIQDERMLFPLSFDDLIPSNDPVRIINKVVDKLDLSKVYTTYKYKGAAAYHPRMLLKRRIPKTQQKKSENRFSINISRRFSDFFAVFSSLYVQF